MKAAHGAAIPLDNEVMLDVTDKQGERDGEVDRELYWGIISSVIYIAFATRPDISLAIAALGQFNSRSYARQ